jgi:hypothetical protein
MALIYEGMLKAEAKELFFTIHPHPIYFEIREQAHY